MDYVIEKIVLFDGDACRLINVQTGDDFALSLTHTQLLSLLIEHQGFAVSRNEIFEKIFDPNAAQATNNNLNQNISILRKYLSQLGIESEVITTVPRVGFMIRDEVLLESRPKESVAKAELPGSVSAVTGKNIVSLIQGAMLTLLIILCSALGAWLLWSFNTDRNMLDPDKLPALSYEKISDVNGCVVNKLTVRGAGDDYLIDDAGLRASMDEMRCDNAVNSQFYISKNTVSQNNYRAFTLKCIKAMSGQYDCYSIYKSVEVD